MALTGGDNRVARDRERQRGFFDEVKKRFDELEKRIDECEKKIIILNGNAVLDAAIKNTESIDGNNND